MLPWQVLKLLKHTELKIKLIRRNNLNEKAHKYYFNNNKKEKLY